MRGSSSDRYLVYKSQLCSETCGGYEGQVPGWLALTDEQAARRPQSHRGLAFKSEGSLVRPAAVLTPLTATPQLLSFISAFPSHPEIWVDSASSCERVKVATSPAD